ncbi:MAG TPA: alpha/beta hydrolase [Blastocatellia bacterium]|nr:alpha/beta hydrolase [Blastocatellia bacterium]
MQRSAKRRRHHLQASLLLVIQFGFATPSTGIGGDPNQASQQNQVTVRKVRSKDGTAIAFDQSGKGPVLVLVAAALSTRSSAAKLAALLTTDFTVINYDRRGRGDSGDTPPYAVEREVEDIEALINEAGGSAFLFGSSSGAVLALEATNRLPAKVKKLAVYEPPFVVDDSRPRVPSDFAKQVTELASSGRRSEAVEYFMTKGVGVPPDYIAQMRKMPMWAGLEKLAHTIGYDAAVMGDTQAGKPLPSGRWKSARSPTLVMDGGETAPWLHTAADALAKILPNAQRQTLKGQDHGVVTTAPEALAPVLVEFFTAAPK